MKSLVQKLALVALAVVIALPLAAADKEKRGKKKKGGMAGPVAQLKKQLAGIDLTDEQQKKIEEIVAKYAPKLEEAAEDAGSAPKKVAEARKKLQQEGKKGRELQQAIRTEANLSAEEQEAVDKLRALNRELRSEVAAVLNEEQREKAKLNVPTRKKRNR